MHDEFFTLLKTDHETLKNLLAELKDTDDDQLADRERLFQRVREEHVPHMEAEESAFYPVLEQKESARGKALESVEEHHVTKLLLDELESLAKTDEKWTAKLKVFSELVHHHIDEEQEEIFEAARKNLDHEEIGQIMADFQQKKAKTKETVAVG